MASMDLPNTMRVWSYSRRGIPRDILRLDAARALPPLPQKNQVLVQVHYVGMTPSMSNFLMLVPNLRGRETVAEIEYSGIVVSAGSDADKRFVKGQTVFGAVDEKRHMFSGAGTMQDYLLLDANDVNTVPENLDMMEAAGIGCVGLTARNMIQSAGVTKDSRVFVNGASGGVGLCCVQACKAYGAYVVATCSEQSRQLVESLKPDEIVDYRAHSPLGVHLTKEYQFRPFDAILDCVGTQELYVQSPQYLKSGSLYINAGAYEGIMYTIFNAVKNTYWPRILGGIPRKWIMITTPAVDPVRMALLLALVDAGQMKMPIDSVWNANDGIEEVFKAYDRLLSQRAKGRVIIKLLKD